MDWKFQWIHFYGDNLIVKTFLTMEQGKNSNIVGMIIRRRVSIVKQNKLFILIIDFENLEYKRGGYYKDFDKMRVSTQIQKMTSNYYNQ